MKRKITFGTRRLAPVLVLVLCAFYLLFSVGVIKATHFCMGREASVAYFTSDTKKCACSLFAKEADDCCDDSHSLIKLEDSQKQISSFQLPMPALALLGAIFNEASASDDHLAVLFPPHAGETGPPPKLLFKQHCSFVFYDRKSIA